MRLEMNKKTWGIILGVVIITIIYFSYNIVLGYDSSQYVWLSEMLAKNVEFANWSTVRSFVFPLGIHVLNILFGKNKLAILIGTFIFYAIMLISIYKIYKDIIQENEKNKIIKAIFIVLLILLVALNPIIFGFYHVLLTEFASITIAILMCVLVWQWLKINFKENKLKYIIYTIVFAFLTICSWHLKQPYILTTLVPLITAIIISLIENFNKTNIIQRIIVLIICLISLFISMKCWNYVLDVKGVKQDASKSSEGLLGRTIMEGITRYRADKNDEIYIRENIEKDERITEEDKKQILEIIDGKSEQYKNFILLDKGTFFEPEGNRKVIFTKEENISVGEGIKFVFGTLTKEPQTVIRSYINNYLAIIDIYKVKVNIDYGNYYYIDETFSFEQDTEITFLGYCIYRSAWNALDLPDFYSKYCTEYISVNEFIHPVNKYMVSMMLPAKVLFKIIMLFLPVFWIVKLVQYFVRRKKYKKDYIYNNHIVFILYTYALMQMLMYTALGSLMDRYAVAPLTATLVAFIIDIYLNIRKKQYKIEKPKEIEAKKETEETKGN